MNTVSLIVYSASDVSKTKKLFETLLGTGPYADTPYYAGFKAGSVEIGVTPRVPGRALPGALAYVDVANIKSSLAALLDAGAELIQDVTDVANGLLVAVVKDSDGTPIGLRQSPER